MKNILSSYLVPTRLHQLVKDYKNKEISLLDVGCNINSAHLIKKWIPKCKYFGLDNYPITNKLFDHYYQIDLTKSNLSEIPDNFFDFVLFSHTIEHIPNGLEVIQNVIPKLKNHGRIYIEFPSVRSLSFPPAKNGILNFCDDNSHIRLYDIKEIANILLKNRCKICRAGKARRVIKTLLAYLVFPYQLYHFIRYGKFLGGLFLWDIFGFCDFVYAERK